jgi:hypothetical protein
MPHIEHAKGWPSVTMILDVLAKPFLIMWYGKYGTAHCNKVKKAGADVGTMFHAAVENRIKGIPALPAKTKTEKQVEHMVNNLFDQWVNLGVEVLHTEMSLEDTDLEFHGTFDALVRINGKLYVVDWKTSNQMDEINHPLQLSAYAHLFNIISKEQVNDGIIVRVDKKTFQVQVETYSNLAFYFEEFKNARSLYDYVNKRGKWEDAA